MVSPVQTSARILVVEDDRDISEVLQAYLSRAGYAVERAFSVPDAMRLYRQWSPNLVLLDIGLPGGDGIDLLVTIRAGSNTPVIMVTAQDDDVTKLSALRVGADDYVVKPFNPAEVVERVRAVLRRVMAAPARKSLSSGPLEIDLEAKLAFANMDDGERKRIQLTPTEFAILAHLCANPGRVYGRNQLLELCAPDSEAYDRVIDSHISKLRRKLAAWNCAHLIEPVHGLGYRFWPGS